MFQREAAHWHQFFEDLQISPLELYKTLEGGIANHRVPETTAKKIEFHEGGPLSSKRIYLQIRRDWLTYHVCFAPFGTGFFVSSRLLFSRWIGWRIMVRIAAIIIIICAAVGIVAGIFMKKAIVGLAIAASLFMPMFWLFVLIIVIWGIFCLHVTYYRLDTMAAFQEAIHRLVVATVNTVIEANGRKPLSDEQSKPILHKLLRR